MALFISAGHPFLSAPVRWINQSYSCTLNSASPNPNSVFTWLLILQFVLITCAFKIWKEGKDSFSFQQGAESLCTKSLHSLSPFSLPVTYARNARRRQCFGNCCFSLQAIFTSYPAALKITFKQPAANRSTACALLVCVRKPTFEPDQRRVDWFQGFMIYAGKLSWNAAEMVNQTRCLTKSKRFLSSWKF